MAALIRKRRQEAEELAESSRRRRRSSGSPGRPEARRPRLIDSSTDPPSPRSIVRMCRRFDAGNSPSVHVRPNVGFRAQGEEAVAPSDVPAGSGAVGLEAGVQADTTAPSAPSGVPGGFGAVGLETGVQANAGDVDVERGTNTMGRSLMEPFRNETGTVVTSSDSSFSSIDLQNVQPIGISLFWYTKT